MKLRRNIDKLLICGGGFKFYYIYGSIKYLHELKILTNINEYIGISAGAMLCLLFSIGYLPEDLEKFFVEFQFDKLIDPHIDNLLENKGLDDGELLKTVIQEMLRRLKFDPDITFKDLYQKTNKKLTFVASNITKIKLELMDHNTYPDMPIWKGILITSALPMVYQPIIHNNEYLIDGGAFDNYPIELFHDENILGINLALQIKNIDLNIDFFNYIVKLYTILHHWNNINKIDRFKKYTIEIPTFDATDIMNTNIDMDEKIRRIKYGYDCAVKHFQEFEYQESEEEDASEDASEEKDDVSKTDEENQEDASEEKDEDDASEEKNQEEASETVEEIKSTHPNEDELIKKLEEINYVT